VQKITHRSIESNGIRMHLAERGEGPLVLLCHGFPESWYSWRHQLVALADAGFRAVAPDMRGYGQTDRPAESEKYTLLHLVGDMVGVLDALEAPTAVIAGHDWGAPVAWHAALLRPERFRAVIGLSVPFRPRGSRRPTSVMPQSDDAVFYQLYFQAPGVAEAELERDVEQTMRAVLGGSFDGNIAMVPRRGGFLAGRRSGGLGLGFLSRGRWRGSSQRIQPQPCPPAHRRRSSRASRSPPGCPGTRTMRRWWRSTIPRLPRWRCAASRGSTAQGRCAP